MNAGFDESILFPVEVVVGEPEPRTILKLDIPRRLKSRSVGKPLPRGDNWEAARQQPLPERIKIYSAPFMTIMSQLTSDASWSYELGNSVVILRPYQDLFYYQTQFREWLDRLETEFRGFDGTKDVSHVFTGKDESNHEDKTGSSIILEGSGNSLKGRLSTSPEQNRALDGEYVEERNSDHVHVSSEAEDGVSEDGDDGSVIAADREKRLANSITALIHLRSLVEFIDHKLKPKQDYLESTSCNQVSFNDLWHLFKPGTEVVEQGGKQAYVVIRVQVPIHKIEEPWGRWSRGSRDDSEEQPTEDWINFRLYCTYIDFDGKYFGPISKTFIIPPFGDLKPITSLLVYPVRFKGQDARRDLINQGQLLLEVADFKAMYYTGATLDKRDEIDSQVVVDFSEALANEERRAAWEPTIGRAANTGPQHRAETLCTAMCCRRHRIYDGFTTDLKMTTNYIGKLLPDTRARSLILSPRSLEDTLSAADELTETELLIMTYRVFGFVLRSRKWAQLDLNLLRRENSSARDLTIDAFKSLELPDGHRELVQSLVTQHFRNRQSTFTRDVQTDLVQGKGVGKTTTAEGIAELFRKPLFQITCGDLGTTAKEVEEDLEKSFALASRWGCILLLDEADVFLAARSKNDFTRNGLVAVFLRVLEYYTGILFLTTNRIGDLDEAFASRIQMSLHYPELDEYKTLKVFRLHLDLIEQRFRKQGRIITFDISSVEDFASQHYNDQPFNRWNGRQIRNACHTALALAEFDSQKNGSEISLEIDNAAPVSLQLKYFKVVQKAYLDFGEYLANIQGTVGDDRAFQLRLRARKNTPFEKQSLFDSHPGPGQRRRPQASSRLSDMSSPFNTQAESFHDNQNRHQRQYSGAASLPMQGYGSAAPYSQTAGGSYRDYGNAPAHGQQMHGQQAPMDTRFPTERQQAPMYESPQGGLQPSHSGEAHLHPSLSHDGSPLPHRPAQPQSLQYGYSSELQADTMRSTAPRVPDPADVTHPGYTYRDGSQGGPSRVPYQGGSLPQT
ncbi:AAA family ATPase [Colletotrichum camelliae]|nr:AAA family ATPase [Colletotrichum camelliae]